MRRRVTGGNVGAMSNTATQIIVENGGARAVAAAIGKKPGAVRLWKHRNSIPRDAWPDLITTFPGITLERLLASEAPVAEPRSAA